MRQENSLAQRKVSRRTSQITNPQENTDKKERKKIISFVLFDKINIHVTRIECHKKELENI